MSKGYRQCGIMKMTQDPFRWAEQTCYIPEEFAKLNEYIKIKENGVWSDGWKVWTIGAFSENPPDWRKAIRGHRGHTGDSTPKVKDE